jgi:hypothetical protein
MIEAMESSTLSSFLRFSIEDQTRHVIVLPPGKLDKPSRTSELPRKWINLSTDDPKSRAAGRMDCYGSFSGPGFANLSVPIFIVLVLIWPSDDPSSIFDRTQTPVFNMSSSALYCSFFGLNFIGLISRLIGAKEKESGFA